MKSTTEPDLYAHDLTGVAWRKSTHSAGEGQCVEIAELPGGIALRDSKNPHQPALRYSAQAWMDFLRDVVNGDL